MVEQQTQGTGWIILRRWPRESATRAIVVTLLVCMLCSGLIATAVNQLQPYRDRNQARQRSERIQAVIAAVPGLAELMGPLASGQLESRLVDLASGSYVTHEDPNGFDDRQAARDPDTSLSLPAERDLAGIGRRARSASVFLVYDGDELRLLVLPVYGAGYISTLYGYLALDADLNTVRGLTFYEHAETPGLGSEIENPGWLAKWPGKLLRDPTGVLRIEVARGTSGSSEIDSQYQVDGISGATRTGTGVSQLLRFWLGPDGFGPYLGRIERERGPS